jgi:mono/diheme cytochrome c family protein
VGVKDRIPCVVRGPLSSRRLNLRATAAIAALGALLVAGCNKDSGDLNRGQQLFTARCASCHTLAAANANGQQGPSLDDAFAAARARGMDSDTIAGVVKAQVENPRPMNQNPSVSMPPDLASGQDLNDIAAYVGAVAGTGQKPPQLSPPQLFVANCGSCHTLSQAGTSGTTGPDLNTALAGTTKGFIHTSIVDPNQKIAKGYPPNVMPQNFETTIQASDLNALVNYLYASTNGGGTSSSGK